MFYIIILILLVSINFDNLFFNFHILVFDNLYWLLNPETDNLIVLFPAQFFYDAVINIIIYSAIISILIIIFGIMSRNKV